MSDKVVVSFVPGSSWQVGPVAVVRVMVDQADLLQQLVNFRLLWEQAAAESGEDIHGIKIDLAMVLDDIEQMITGAARF